MTELIFFKEFHVSKCFSGKWTKSSKAQLTVRREEEKVGVFVLTSQSQQGEFPYLRTNQRGYWMQTFWPLRSNVRWYYFSQDRVLNSQLTCEQLWDKHTSSHWTCDTLVLTKTEHY